MLPTRLWSNGMISASQADDPGSIPGSRTSLYSENARDLVEYVMDKDENSTSTRQHPEGFDGGSSNPTHYASDMF